MTALTPRDALARGLIELEISSTDEQVDCCLEYLELIQRWNRVDNLTAVTSLDAMVSTHLLDSLTLHRFLHGETILDVGSGAGLPGIPLALFNSEKRFILLDAAAKRVRFMRQAIVALKLPNVSVTQLRIEGLPSSQRFDHIVSRAFSALDLFVSAAVNHLKGGGSLLAMKGRIPKAELATLPDEITYTINTVSVPGLSAQRHVIEISPDSQ